MLRILTSLYHEPKPFFHLKLNKKSNCNTKTLCITFKTRITCTMILLNTPVGHMWNSW